MRSHSSSRAPRVHGRERHDERLERREMGGVERLEIVQVQASKARPRPPSASGTPRGGPRRAPMPPRSRTRSAQAEGEQKPEPEALGASDQEGGDPAVTVRHEQQRTLPMRRPTADGGRATAGTASSIRE